MMLFSQDDGSSLQLPAASCWEVSRPLDGRPQLFAVGSASGNRTESDILRVYDVAQLRVEKAQPVSRYSSYEGIVTALAFANQSTRIAFCVRERAVHRLFVADAARLDATMTQIQEYPHKKPWIAQDADPGVAGITSLAFTPDDGLLVAHGQYETQLFKLSAWKLSGDSLGTLRASADFNRENKEKPFIAERTSRALRFMQRPGSEILIAEDDSRYVIWNLTTGEFKEIPFLPMQKGLPERSLSEDGKWLIMGDDRGNVYIWDVATGERFSVAYATEAGAESTATLNARNASQERVRADDRPAHTGPVVGVALSLPGLHGNFPEFAATIGEENRVIVWDLIPVLGNRATIPPKAAKRPISRKP